MTKTNLNMDVLRTFVTGVRLGNFSKAATRIGRSQSAISLQIRRLEQQVGVQLFSRDGRSLTLSEAGKTLYGYAERMIDLNDEAIETVAKKDVEGDIRLGIPPDLAETWLPHMLARFSRSHPGVSMEARVDRNATLLEDVAEKRLDVALVWDRGPPGAAAGEQVAELPIIWIAADGNAFSPSDKLPLVVMGEPCLFRAHGLSTLRNAGMDWRITFTSSSLAGLWAATSAGLGLAIRTPAALPVGLSALTHPSLPDLGTVTLRVHMADEPSRSVRHFTAILIETVREMF